MQRAGARALLAVPPQALERDVPAGIALPVAVEARWEPELRACKTNLAAPPGARPGTGTPPGTPAFGSARRSERALAARRVFRSEGAPRFAPGCRSLIGRGRHRVGHRASHPGRPGLAPCWP